MSFLRSIVAREALRIVHKTSCRVRKLYEFEGVKLIVPCGVFNPTYTISSNLLARVLRILKPRGLIVDYGCGSGALSIFIAKNFSVSKVVCYDTSIISLKTAKVNARINNVADKIIVVDKLNHIYDADILVSNPPYLPIDPRNGFDLNWCSGRGLEALRRFLLDSLRLLKRGGTILVAYSSLTGVERVKEIAGKLGLREVYTFKKYTPIDTIYTSILIRI